MNYCLANSREGELQINDNHTVPFLTLLTDHFGPLIKTSNDLKHILIVVDAFTRYTWFFPVKSTRSKETIKHLFSLFLSFGNPETLITDRDTAFTSQEFAEFLRSHNIKHRQIAIGAPWANGIVKRINRFLKSCLKKLVTESKKWNTFLEIIRLCNK